MVCLVDKTAVEIQIYPYHLIVNIMTKEYQIEQEFIQKLIELKYNYRPDITDRKSLELNFRNKFEALNKVQLTDHEFLRLRDEIITPDVF